MYNYQDSLVSLVTPGWNGREFVHRLLDSILSQTYRPIQYIYVDDGSTDGTAEIVNEYRDRFAQADIDFLFIQQDNSGMCEALMTGFQYVKGSFLSNPEYDDILLPESVAERVRYLNTHTDCAVVVADAWMVPENNLDERKELISHKNPNRFDRNHFYQCLMSDTIFNAACYMVRMDKFDETHPERKIIPYKYGSNQQILLPLYYHYNRGFIDKPLSLFVNRTSSLSKPSLSSFDDYLSHVRLYEETILQTLTQIDMLEEDRRLYGERVRISFEERILEMAYKRNDKPLFLDIYKSLESKGELKQIYLEYRRRITSPLFCSLRRLSNIYNRFRYHLHSLYFMCKNIWSHKLH